MKLLDRILLTMLPSARRLKGRARRARLRFTRPIHRSVATNVYHCCVQKTASQWIRAILSDPAIYRHGGLVPYQYSARLPGGYDGRSYQEKVFVDQFPPRTIATPFYVSYPAFAAMPKPESYRAFFVSRDPRDILVSSYYSVRYSHGLNPSIADNRPNLQRLSLEDGLAWQLDNLARGGLFAALESWISAPNRDPNVALIRYEELVGRMQTEAVARLLNHCDIRMPPNELDSLLARLSFERLSGRSQGQEDQKSHYRKGVPGDWRAHLPSSLVAQLESIAGQAIEAFGFEPQLEA